MTDDQRNQLDQMEDATLSDIERKAERKIRYRNNRANTLWFGLGTMGIVGWSVAIPVVLGTLGGVYLDEQVAGSFSWTLTGLVLGLLLGCMNAWYWISKNQTEIQQQRELDGDSHD